MKNKVFFSVFQGYELDGLNHMETWRKIKKLKPLLVNGKYSGKTELSFCLDLTRLDLVESIAREFNQESILIVNQHGQAFLKYLKDSKLVNIGKFKAVSKKSASKLDAWSNINGQFYCVEKMKGI